MSSGESAGPKPQHGGVVFRVAGESWFLPASIAVKVMPMPEVARVPGGPPELRGVALVDGNMIPVVDLLHEAAVVGALAAERTGQPMLVCAVLGESLGLVGIEVLATGRFDAGERPGEVMLDGASARPFDVAGIIARVREGRWAV